MNTTLYALLSLAVATLSVGAVGETRQCTTYATIGIEGTTCEERSGLICSEGCSTFPRPDALFQTPGEFAQHSTSSAIVENV
ncbi:hypothetical protein MJO28_007461 [Puccinia striiformis f. sp. tritici]|uniref:Uncharacterized protein n=1 Tax=Puccinia striiformis f. sp. tritici TaxID=168172 RepID=A0ACC0EHG6_9BASI|nr:hypothetical protein MJO28_007461 [Puccinia striiformis f. sp. tritici]